jgi:hypothetical protein
MTRLGGIDPNEEVLKLLEDSLRPLAGEKLTVSTLLIFSSASFSM